MTTNVYTRETPVPRTFECPRCGDVVTVTERSDRRMRFCSAYCEREFWRHRERYERGKDTSRGHVTYLSRERSENMREAGF